jgi:hypothetical protein
LDFILPAGVESSVGHQLIRTESRCFDDNPLYVEMYWKAWELAFRNFYEPHPGSGFISQCIDAAFNWRIPVAGCPRREAMGSDGAGGAGHVGTRLNAGGGLHRLQTVDRAR